MQGPIKGIHVSAAFTHPLLLHAAFLLGVHALNRGGKNDRVQMGREKISP